MMRKGMRRNVLAIALLVVSAVRVFACEPFASATEWAQTDPNGASAALGEMRVCLPASPSSPLELKDLSGALDLLEQPGTYSSYFNRLIDSSGVKLCVDPTSVQCRGYFEPEPNVIAVAAGLSQADKALILVHELRHLDQKRRGFGLDLGRDMLAHVRLTYAMEADAQAFTAMFAWSARAQGHIELWDAVTKLEHYEDIANAFKVEMEKGGKTPDAMGAAFAAWFDSSWRREQYYLSAAGNYLDQLDERHAIRKFDPLPEGALDELCHMPDGSRYDCSMAQDQIGGTTETPRR